MKKLSMKNRDYFYYWCVVVCCVLSVSCGEETAGKQTTAPDTTLPKPAADTAALRNGIVPGERLGHITLGLIADSIETILGTPDSSDAAMGKAWLTWRGKEKGASPSVLNLYTAYKDTSMAVKTVQQIRTTSPFFKTFSNVHVGSSVTIVQQQFPAVIATATYTQDSAAFTLYDDVAAGIAFEISNAVCSGILIHKKGARADAIYMMLHPDMKKK